MHVSADTDKIQRNRNGNHEIAAFAKKISGQRSKCVVWHKFRWRVLVIRGYLYRSIRRYQGGSHGTAAAFRFPRDIYDKSKRKRWSNYGVRNVKKVGWHEMISNSLLPNPDKQWTFSLWRKCSEFIVGLCSSTSLVNLLLSHKRRFGAMLPPLLNLHKRHWVAYKNTWRFYCCDIPGVSMETPHQGTYLRCYLGDKEAQLNYNFYNWELACKKDTYEISKLFGAKINNWYGLEVIEFTAADKLKDPYDTWRCLSCTIVLNFYNLICFKKTQLRPALFPDVPQRVDRVRTGLCIWGAFADTSDRFSWNISRNWLEAILTKTKFTNKYLVFWKNYSSSRCWGLSRRRHLPRAAESAAGTCYKLLFHS